MFVLFLTYKKNQSLLCSGFSFASHGKTQNIIVLYASIRDRFQVLHDKTSLNFTDSWYG